MGVHSFDAVPAAQVCAFPRKAERTRMNDVVVFGNKKSVLVSREVADYLEEDRKREQAEAR